MTVDQGDRRFTLVLFIGNDANPSVSFHPTDGQPLPAKFYFGTGGSVRHHDWSDKAN